MDSHMYGPPLPPGFKHSEEEDNKESECEEKFEVTCDKRNNKSKKTNSFIGPAVPSFLLQSNSGDSDSSSNETLHNKSTSDIVGPTLPPGFSNTRYAESDSVKSPATSTDIVGPAIPVHLLKSKKSESENSDDEVLQDNEAEAKSSTIGPALPPGFLNTEPDGNESEEDYPYGPVPAVEKANELEDVVVSLEKRAKNMRQKLEKGDTPVVEKIEREEWMTTPNMESRNQLGVISRCLIGGSSDKSSRKRPGDEIQKHSRSSAIDEKLTKEMKKYNKSKRSESLLDMHRKEKKKKEKESSKPPERKPFDRDSELAVRHFTKEQVNSVIKKSKYLNSRFAPGTSHYL